MAGFEFFDAVATAFQDFKKGARVLSDVTPEEQRGFIKPPTVDLESNIRPVKAPLRDMEDPLGLGLPKMDTAHRYFQMNLSRDTVLRQVQSQDYYVKPVVPKKATMNIGSDAKVKGFTATYKTTGVTGL